MARDGFIQLPNGDLWRGSKVHEEQPMSAEDQATLNQGAPIDRAMSAMLIAAKGSQTLTCFWCDQQFAERPMREHLRTNHKSVVEPAPAAAVAVADAVVARAELEAATKTEE